MAEAPPPPTPTPQTAHASDPSSSASPAPRSLPPTLLLPPSSSSSRRARGGSARSRVAAALGTKGKAMGSVTGAEGGRNLHDGLVKAVRVVGRDVDAGVAGADILELAMAKGSMFSWLSYWPEEGYPKEGQPY